MSRPLTFNLYQPAELSLDILPWIGAVKAGEANRRHQSLDNNFCRW